MAAFTPYLSIQNKMDLLASRMQSRTIGCNAMMMLDLAMNLIMASYLATRPNG